MEVLDVTRDMERYDQVVDLQRSAFPANENYSMDQILGLAERDGIEYKSFWEDDVLCGILFYNCGADMIYLFYIAVNPTLRSKGYGTRLLSWLGSCHPDKAIVLNVEPTGLGSENEDQRVRRMAFYERHGFRSVGTRLSDDSGLYDILSTSRSFNSDEYMRLIFDLGFDSYHPRLISKAAVQ